MGHNKRFDYIQRRARVEVKLDLKAGEFESFIIELYSGQRLSGKDISDKLYNDTGELISSKMIQRIAKKYNVIRTSKEAFKLKADNGLINWKYKELKIKRLRLNTKLRYQVLKRDGFKCVLCGNTPPNTALEVDHVIRVCEGGKDTMDNLRTLCHECNHGRG